MNELKNYWKGKTLKHADQKKAKNQKKADKPDSKLKT